MDSESQSWRLPLAIAVGGAVLSALILTALKALTNVLGDLSFGQLMLWIVLPSGAVCVTVALALWVWLLRREVTRLSSLVWGSSSVLRHHVVDIQRLQLNDVIATAEAHLWRVESHSDGLLFVSPDGAGIFAPADHSDDPVGVADDPVGIAAYPVGVAALLHDHAPDSFPEQWDPFVEVVAARANALADRVGSLAERLTNIERSLGRRLAEAVLSTVLPEAVSAGWEVEWSDTQVRFLRNNEIATVHFDAIDVPRLRAVISEPPSR